MNDPKTVLITGASSGIGYELAKLFARDGHNLVLVARSGGKLTQVSDELHRQFNILAQPVAMDMATTAAPQLLFDELQREGIRVDILVNNAGYAKYGEFADIPLEESQGQIQLNIATLTALTKLFVAPMLERRSGKIMNVASTAGFQPGPLMAVYYATKAYVISFSEALANELKGSGVTITCFCPGATDTGFQHRAENADSRLFKTLRPMGVKRVARDGYRGLGKNKTLVISGARNWIVAESVRFTPRKIATAISRWVSEKA
ncbi:MAG TPA: SDR family oxidoreductase [Terriglobales bacterium]|nr:SDR family oxidoreductase [Terriglobales bacterium]